MASLNKTIIVRWLTKALKAGLKLDPCSDQATEYYAPLFELTWAPAILKELQLEGQTELIEGIKAIQAIAEGTDDIPDDRTRLVTIAAICLSLCESSAQAGGCKT